MCKKVGECNIIAVQSYTRDTNRNRDCRREWWELFVENEMKKKITLIFSPSVFLICAKFMRWDQIYAVRVNGLGWKKELRHESNSSSSWYMFNAQPSIYVSGENSYDYEKWSDFHSGPESVGISIFFCWWLNFFLSRFSLSVVCRFPFHIAIVSNEIKNGALNRLPLPNGPWKWRRKSFTFDVRCFL